MRALAVALLLALAFPAHAESIRVIDGDTFMWGSERVRIENIDAPEIEGKCDYERRLAQDAKRELGRLLFSGQVELRRIPRKDRYGRTLAKVSVNGQDVGQAMIAKQVARPWRGKREPWC
jgi:endonuclease YncB( thermonuclease family)